MLYSISKITQDYRIKSLLISFGSNIKTGGKETREDNASGTDTSLPMNSGTRLPSSKHRFFKVKKNNNQPL